MRLALVVNPRSGTAPDPEELERRLAADGAEVATTAIDELNAEDGRLDADRSAAGVRALSKAGRPDRIVVAGGDGSIGLCARLALELRVPLAVIPVGTANDFARAYGLPHDLDEACELARDPAAETTHADLAEVGGRPFVNAASAGLSVIAAREARPHKARLGPLAYAAGAVKAALTASPLRCRVLCDGSERYAGKVWQVVVAVTGAFGGGSEIGGTGERRLDVAIVPAGSRVGLVRRAYGMRVGKLTAQDDVPHLRGRVVDVELEDDHSFNVDGELCRCTPAHFVLLPEGFEVVVP
ncbi:MAG: diacylglycerol/lipid kinase family protein [Solirubrobacteraceae bacterium]